MAKTYKEIGQRLAQKSSSDAFADWFILFAGNPFAQIEDAPCFDLSSKLFRNAILVAVMASGMSTVVAAQDAMPANGLGQSWPNAPDVSSSAHYHVYRFERDGMTYIQVNDLQGKVLGAVAATQDVTFALPIGADAQNGKLGAERAPTDLTEVVYQDDGLTVMAAPQGGSASITALAAKCEESIPCSQNGVLAR